MQKEVLDLLDHQINGWMVGVGSGRSINLFYR